MSPFSTPESFTAYLRYLEKEAVLRGSVIKTVNFVTKGDAVTVYVVLK